MTVELEDQSENCLTAAALPSRETLPLWSRFEGLESRASVQGYAALDELKALREAAGVRELPA